MGQAGFKDNTGEKVPSPTSLAPPFGLKVVCVSDTHGRHRKVNVPAGDVLIHAGDWTHFGKLRDVTDFNEWLGEQPHKHKIVINGGFGAGAMDGRFANSASCSFTRLAAPHHTEHRRQSRA
mmetsp:Transcript_27167/g.47410  ORF Transcript_27167/g.47410 Transcript_27167/m.47410 type:complete len:121 (+) Transcript_27167:41-403(+)